MRRALRVYSRLLAAGFAQQSAYRLAAFGGLVANATFGLLKVSILGATVTAAGGSVAGYDATTIGAYVWLSQGLLGSVNLYGRSDVATRIKDGDVVVDLLRPLDLQASTITTEVGKALFNLLPRGLPSVAIGLLAGMVLPTSLLAYALGLVSVLLGIVVSFATVYLVAAAGFWLVETRGLQVLYMMVSGFFAGLFVPITLFPGWLRVIAEATPFPSMLMYPVDILSGRVLGADAAVLLAVQAGWLVAVLAAGHLMTRAGRRRLEVQGG
ncbi:MAG TPA: ABC-2 family transporter protein [Actinomycetales bacterium]